MTDIVLAILSITSAFACGCIIGNYVIAGVILHRNPTGCTCPKYKRVDGQWMMIFDIECPWHGANKKARQADAKPGWDINGD